MLEHALELAAQGYSLEKIETLLHYAGYADARQRLWWPIVCREVSAAAERARRLQETKALQTRSAACVAEDEEPNFQRLVREPIFRSRRC
jgi:hypothetical protein